MVGLRGRPALPVAWLLPCAILILGIGLSRLPWLAAMDLAWMDSAFRIVRLAGAAEAASPPVGIIGFDEASIARSGKPFALMHDEFAAVLDGLRLGAARAVAVDMVFPARAFDALIPGSTKRLALSLGQLRASTPLVIGSDTANGSAAQVYKAMAGPGGLAALLVAADADGVLRRIDDRLGQGDARVPLLAATLAAKLQPTRSNGIVDFARGAPFTYIPAAKVVDLVRAGDVSGLVSLFKGKIFLVGVILADQDRQRIPVSLASWEPGTAVAGVVFQAQALRSMLQGGMIQPMPWLGDAIALLALGVLWVARARLAVATVAGAGLVLLTGAASVLLLVHGVYVPIVAIMLSVLLGLAAIWLDSFRRTRAEKGRIRHIFAGYISPAILDAIISGELRDGTHSGRRQLAFLFADMRGFTAYSAVREPEQVIAYLNRYYTVITEVLHQHGGTIDKFSGDGVMVFFGAPQHSANPANDAIRAGTAMLAALEPLNRALVAEGDTPIAIGIGIACGAAVIGNVGGSERHDYTATGAAVNLAAHIQQYCKQAPYPMLVEQGAFDNAALDADLQAHFETIEVNLEKHGNTVLAGFTPPPARND